MKVQHVKQFQANVKNGSVDAFFAGKKLEFLGTTCWLISTAVVPDFDLFEYRVCVPKYRPLTPKEAIEYLGETIVSGYAYKLVFVGEAHVRFERDNYQFDISYNDLMTCKHNNVLLRREVDA